MSSLSSIYGKGHFFISICLGCLPLTSCNEQHQSNCVVEREGRRMFLGTDQCLERLPQQRLSGVWVLGHEYSVFYEGATGYVPVKPIPKSASEDVWLTANANAILADQGIQYDGQTHQYLVEFIGTMSKEPGFYGDGLYSRGAIVIKMLRLRQID